MAGRAWLGCGVVALGWMAAMVGARAANRAHATGTHTAGTNRMHAVLDPLMEKAVADGNIPRGELLVCHDGRVVYRKAFGWRALEPQREPMKADTIFDMASLTKCIATATSVMKLVEDGRVRLNDPVAKYLPEFAQNGKADITVRELLTHYSGLAPDLDLTTEWQGRDAAYAMAMSAKPAHPPGSGFVY